MANTGLTLTIEIFEERGQKMVWIGAENGSGAEYPIENEGDIGDAVKKYLEIYYPEAVKKTTSDK